MALGPSGAFLVDTRATTLEQINDGNFAVDSHAVRLEAFGLTSNDFAQVQILIGPNAGDQLWQDLVLGGVSIRLDGSNSQRILMLGGKYRVHYAGEAEVVVYCEQDLLELDKNVFYNYEQPAPFNGGGGFALTTSGSSTLNLDFTGDSSGGELSGSVRVSASPLNTIQAFEDGIYSKDSSIIYMGNQTDDFGIPIDNTAYTVTTTGEQSILGTLPSASEAANSVHVFQALGSGTFNLGPDGTDTINGVSANTTVTNGTSAFLYCDGVSNWMMVGGV